MEGSIEGSPPPSLCMIRAAELFPKPKLEKEDDLNVPFKELAGESVRYLGRSDDGVVALSNYRLFLLKNSINSEISVPLGLIESAQIRDLFHLIINCKDASTVKCSFETAEQCTEWHRRITLAVGVPETLEALFAFPFYSWTSDLDTSTGTIHNIGTASNNGDLSMDINDEWIGRLQRSSRYEEDFRKEVDRLQFDLKGAWRISNANNDFKLCPSYPQQILVPFCIADDTLNNVANFRGSRRLPAVVWRHKQSGAVIARCSQPEVGWLGWRNSKDEQLLKALADACAFDRGEEKRRQHLYSTTSEESAPSSPEGSHEEVAMDEVRKILIVDARSYSAAVTNRARGGGCECIEYYPCAEIEFMNLGNIHAIRKSFHALRQLCSSPPDTPNWLGLLERTAWFQHLSGLLAASMTVCHAVEKKGRPVLVHCSDGWDRTPQIVATAQLCLDPYYRTVEGFRILVEREWLNFGHKFGDRCGHGVGSDDINERCPIFLQWLDLVHQIHKQFTCSFEFSMAYLIKLAQHSHSCLFGTFLCNTLKERSENSIFERTFSVWPFLSGPMYRNPLYVPNKEKVLWPQHNVRDISLWTEVYLGNLANQNITEIPQCGNNTESISPMAKTRSYGDLITAGNSYGLVRRSSDPNMTSDSNLNENSNNHMLIDQKTSEDVIASIHDTTEKLQNLTNELNQSDEEICKINNINETTKKLNISVSNSESDNNYDNDYLSNNLLNNDKHEIYLNNFNDNFVNGAENKYNCTSDILVEKTSLDRVNIDEIDCNDKKTKESFNEENALLNMDCADILKAKQISNLESIDLSDTSNYWHGSVTTSTDTLVPNDTVQVITNNDCEKYLKNELSFTKSEIYTNLSTSSKKLNSTILPAVHSKINSIQTNDFNNMDESILILPEHQKLEISSSGKCELNYTRRRRTSSSNSNKNEILSSKMANGSYLSSAPTSRFSTPGIRSLPLTPPSGTLTERVTLSCPDGLSHALSEQNIRLQQIVYEHKIREEALLRELYGMRMALLKKSCPNCNFTNMPNDESADGVIIDQLNYLCSSKYEENGANCLYSQSPESANNGLDNIESVSNCSWEAVEDRSAPSSGASSTQPCGALWVPDHAVSKCASCQAFFWLGRRKHHCRHCGKIFCSECSEFWAPLPNEQLFNPVRLCGNCYHVVTTKIQQQHQQQNKIITDVINSRIIDQHHQIQHHNLELPSSNNNNNHTNNNNNISVTEVLDGCKVSATSCNDHGSQYKAATASN